MTHLDESIRERLLKVLRLAQQGVGGEKANAEVILVKLLKKHGVTIEALADTQVARTTEWFPVAANEREVFLGLCYSLLGGECRVWKTRGASRRRGVDVTPSEKVALTLAWETYRAAWRRAQQDLITAFRIKHRLFDESAPKRFLDDLTPEELAEYRRQKALAESLEDVEGPRKRLGAGV